MTQSRQFNGSCVTTPTAKKNYRKLTNRLQNLGLTLIFQTALIFKGFAMRPTVTRAPAASASTAFAADTPTRPAIVQTVADATAITQNLLGLPFDMLRAQYARAVQLGLIERSMLRGRDFSRTVGAIEQLTLGPWARHV